MHDERIVTLWNRRVLGAKPSGRDLMELTVVLGIVGAYPLNERVRGVHQLHVTSELPCLTGVKHAQDARGRLMQTRARCRLGL